MRMFNQGDLVSVRDCYELDMPCKVEGADPWCPYVTLKDSKILYMYKVTGKHTKRGNIVNITVSETQLQKWE